VRVFKTSGLVPNFSSNFEFQPEMPGRTAVETQSKHSFKKEVLEDLRTASKIEEL